MLVRSFIVPGDPLGQFALKAGVPIILSTVRFGLNNPSTAVHSNRNFSLGRGNDQHQHRTNTQQR